MGRKKNYLKKLRKPFEWNNGCCGNFGNKMEQTSPYQRFSRQEYASIPPRECESSSQGNYDELLPGDQRRKQSDTNNWSYYKNQAYQMEQKTPEQSFYNAEYDSPPTEYKSHPQENMERLMTEKELTKQYETNNCLYFKNKAYQMEQTSPYQRFSRQVYASISPRKCESSSQGNYDELLPGDQRRKQSDTNNWSYYKNQGYRMEQKTPEQSFYNAEYDSSPTEYKSHPQENMERSMTEKKLTKQYETNNCLYFKNKAYQMEQKTPGQSFCREEYASIPPPEYKSHPQENMKRLMTEKELTKQSDTNNCSYFKNKAYTMKTPGQNFCTEESASIPPPKYKSHPQEKMEGLMTEKELTKQNETNNCSYFKNKAYQMEQKTPGQSFCREKYASIPPPKYKSHPQENMEGLVTEKELTKQSETNNWSYYNNEILQSFSKLVKQVYASIPLRKYKLSYQRKIKVLLTEKELTKQSELDKFSYYNNECGQSFSKQLKQQCSSISPPKYKPYPQGNMEKMLTEEELTKQSELNNWFCNNLEGTQIEQNSAGQSFFNKVKQKCDSKVPNVQIQHDISLYSFPPCDPAVLEEVLNDPMVFVSVGGLVSEVRYYGETSVVIQEPDDPRDLVFESVCRRILIDGVTCVTLETNTAYREVQLSDKQKFSVRLGVPGREIFIDGTFYRVQFGGTPVEVSIAGRKHWIQLEGPQPSLRIGNRRRNDLLAGKVTLMIDESPENMFPLFLDAKPQIFEMDGTPFVIKFVDALRIVLINGIPLRIDYGGLPTPIVHRNRRRLLFVTGLPYGVVPGLVNIVGMETTKHTTNIVPIVINPVPPIDTPTYLYKTDPNISIFSNKLATII